MRSRIQKGYEINMVSSNNQKTDRQLFVPRHFLKKMDFTKNNYRLGEKVQTKVLRQTEFL